MPMEVLSMDESILDSIKRRLGLSTDYIPFDKELIGFINSAMSILTQYGIGPKKGYQIEALNDTWEDYLGDKVVQRGLAEEYIFLYVKQAWDPTGSDTISNVITERLKELTYRLILQAEVGELE